MLFKFTFNQLLRDDRLQWVWECSGTCDYFTYNPRVHGPVSYIDSINTH
jgi:hypothetical protein